MHVTPKTEIENKTLSTTGIEFFHTYTNEANAQLAQSHIHSAIEILYITKGTFRVYVDNETIYASCGDMILLRSNTIHTIFSTNDIPGEYYVLKMKLSFFLQFAEQENATAYLMQLGLRRDNQKILWNADEMTANSMRQNLETIINIHNTTPYTSELIIKANIILLISKILTNTSNDYKKSIDDRCTLFSQEQIYKTIIFINSNFSKPITAKDCSEIANMSYSYFSRLFKLVMGKSFTRYLTEARINNAEKEITLSDKSITEICFSCGFNDTSYFINKYKQLRGISPYKFKQNIKGKM